MLSRRKSEASWKKSPPPHPRAPEQGLTQGSTSSFFHVHVEETATFVYSSTCPCRVLPVPGHVEHPLQENPVDDTSAHLACCSKVLSCMLSMLKILS